MQMPRLGITRCGLGKPGARPIAIRLNCANQNAQFVRKVFPRAYLKRGTTKNVAIGSLGRGGRSVGRRGRDPGRRARTGRRTSHGRRLGLRIFRRTLDVFRRCRRNREPGTNTRGSLLDGRIGGRLINHIESRRTGRHLLRHSVEKRNESHQHGCDGDGSENHGALTSSRAKPLGGGNFGVRRIGRL
jgi:hypothetical protein